MMNNRRIIYKSGLMYVARERGVVVGGVSDRQLRKNVVVVVWGNSLAVSGFTPVCVCVLFNNSFVCSRLLYGCLVRNLHET